uniref:Uncharacterized protein n=1 Tax=Odontella aurita TaxID=265563 RepID=A0A7S4HSZ9_9STRA|mmetsp:Transcript_14634/g.42893  ORF Transcript_14634/g.42893 Transcript_14634/m.42893 type:complete len:136 (+) Transcript_14634:391-798(+)
MPRSVSRARRGEAREALRPIFVNGGPPHFLEDWTPPSLGTFGTARNKRSLSLAFEWLDLRTRKGCAVSNPVLFPLERKWAQLAQCIIVSDSLPTTEQSCKVMQQGMFEYIHAKRVFSSGGTTVGILIRTYIHTCL